MKRFLLISVCVGLVLCVVGPIRERVGRQLSSLVTFQRPEATRQQAVGRTTPRALQPTAPHASSPARRAVEAQEETDEDAQTAIQEYRMRSAKRVKQVQRALKAAGVDPGPIDGLLGHRTHAALIEFQKAHGLEPDGVLGAKTWAALSRSMRSGDVVAGQDTVPGD